MRHSKPGITVLTMLVMLTLLSSCGSDAGDESASSSTPTVGENESFPEDAWIAALTPQSMEDEESEQVYVAFKFPDGDGGLELIGEPIPVSPEYSGGTALDSAVIPLSVSPDNNYILPRERLEPSVNNSSIEPSQYLEVQHMMSEDVVKIDLSAIDEQYYDAGVAPYAAAFDPSKPHSINVSLLIPESDDKISTWQFDIEGADPPKMVKQSTDVSNESEFMHDVSTGLPTNSNDLDYGSWMNVPFGEVGPLRFLSNPELSPISYPVDPFY